MVIVHSYVNVYQRVSQQTNHHFSAQGMGPCGFYVAAQFFQLVYKTHQRPKRQFFAMEHGPSIDGFPMKMVNFPVRNLSHFRRLVTSPMNIYQFSYRTNKHNWLVVSTPLKKIVSWDDYSQYMEKEVKHVPNHQSDKLC